MSTVPLGILVAAVITVTVVAARPLQVAAQISPQRSLLRLNPEVPQDPKYLQYYHWYMNHAVLSLVVSGNDHEHLEENLRKLYALQEKGVLIGEVAIVGALADPSLRQGNSESIKHFAANERRRALLEQLRLQSPQLVDHESTVQRLGVRFSPTWVVRYRGQDFIYEGLRHPVQLFTSEGVFRGR